MYMYDWVTPHTFYFGLTVLSKPLLLNLQDETGSPGLTIAVSVDGKTVWSEGNSISNFACPNN